MSWEVRGDRATFELLHAEWEALADEGRVARGPRSLGGVGLFVKASRLAPAAGRRHAVRRALLRVPVPRLAEYENLAWLRANGFGAPVPVVAAVRWTGTPGRLGGRPDFQALVTRLVEGAPTLAERLVDGPLPGWHVDRLGRQVARLHTLGFVHRDLFARNLLVDDEGRWTFLDAWRGGPRRGSRGPLWDVACLVEEAVSQEFVDAFLAAYRSAGGDAPPARLARERARVRRRFADARRS